MKNNNLPLVSIITVVYNGEKYLEQTIQSVINQTYKNIEYIIIDGGSIDGTLDILKKYENHIAYWHSKPDKGLYDAMNIGIGIAKGELIGMINSDDWYEPNAVELMATAYQQRPDKHIFHGDMYTIDESNIKKLHKFNPSVFKLKYYGATYNHPTFFVTREEYREHKYNTSLVSVADIQFTLEAFLKDKNKFCYIEHPLSNFRLGGVSGRLTKVKALKDGYIARANAGFSLRGNIFTITIRLIYWIVTGLKNKIKINR